MVTHLSLAKNPMPEYLQALEIELMLSKVKADGMRFNRNSIFHSKIEAIEMVIVLKTEQSSLTCL